MIITVPDSGKLLDRCKDCDSTAEFARFPDGQWIAKCPCCWLKTGSHARMCLAMTEWNRIQRGYEEPK